MSTRIHPIAGGLIVLCLAAVVCIFSFPITYADISIQLPSKENRGQLPASAFPGGGSDTDSSGNQDAYVVRPTTDMFTRMTEGPHVNDTDFSMGASWIDCDNDTYMDLKIMGLRYLAER